MQQLHEHDQRSDPERAADVIGDVDTCEQRRLAGHPEVERNRGQIG